MVEPENNPSFLEEKENLRVAISRRMLEIYSSYRFHSGFLRPLSIFY